MSKKFAKITAEQPVEQQLKQIALALAVQVEKKTRQFVGPLHTDYRTLVFEVWQQSPQASEWCGDV
ncbi:MAG: hypothetical protein F6J87_09355 [Spirulina sp. SIO3F2]|nr:hypothetical protein [Spirulina sp. SIO3F2]